VSTFPLRRDISRPEECPSEVSIALIDALYKDVGTFLVGTLLVTGPAFIIYWKTSAPLLLACALAIVLVAAVRGSLMYAYACRRQTITTLQSATRWERLYLGGATVTHLLLGAWCFITFSQSSDPFVYFFSFSVTIIYAAGIFGRNFANPRFVFVQIFCVWAPMVAALVAYGNSYHWIYAVFLTLSLLGIKLMADRLRLTLFNATTASRDVELLAQRFDAALANMPNGLCMFDINGTIVVSNQRLSELMGLADFSLRGLSLRCLFARLIEAGLTSETTVKEVLARVQAKCPAGVNSSLELELHNDRFLEITFQHMDNGGLVFLVEDITARKAAEAEKDRLARFDSLTGLPNRVVLHDRMARALSDCRPGRMCAVHFIDLDQFKQINDTMGHTQGDVLLEAVARRLIEVTRGAGVIARFGGDEFVVLQTPVTSLRQSEDLADCILSTLGGTYDLGGNKVLITASIGIAIAEGPMDTDQFLRKADMALYRAKAEGRGAWRWFEAGMEVRAQARRSLEFDLRNALKAGALDLHYQPLFNLKTRGIETCEALLRWHHPVLGMVPTSNFISVAEEMGIIVEIGKQVLNKACLECLRWPSGTSVAINMSPLQFSRSDVPALVRDALAATHLSPNRLEIEITESTLLQDTARTWQQLSELERMGIKISLDDFGTAYSSLSYLHNFPFHKVKIDQSFLRGLVGDERKGTLLRGITRLSSELGLHVVVEGVETEEQFQLLLADDSIDEVQGYLFARPLPARDIRQLLRVSGVKPTAPWSADTHQHVA
jgi:diguanylate cyclase (GGDEF)-like protein